MSAEVALAAESTYRAIVKWQEQPDIALTVLSGIHITPHQRLMLYQGHQGAEVNVNVSSRGTAKSATMCVLYATYHALLYKGRKIVTLSATGFRGGQLIFSDIEKWMLGGWDSQQPDLLFLPASVKSSARNIVKRMPNYQQIEFANHSSLLTLPTGDENAIRGIRGHVLFIDEADTFDPFTLQAVAIPFLNVGTDFEHGGRYSIPNSIFYTSTISYGWREFQKTVAAAKKGIARDYDAWQALKRGNVEQYRALTKEGLFKYTYTSIDYTDMLIRRELEDPRTGERWKVNWPNPKLQFEHYPRGIPFTVRGEDGYVKRDGEAQDLLSTYPIRKEEIERPLLDGSTEEAIWLMEQRNVVDTATGDVYPHWLLDVVSCERKPIIPFAQCSEAYQAAFADDPRGYEGPVLWRCSDPCVMAVDYAGGERDFSAFVVIRIGPMAKGEFDPLTHHGYTSWSNIIWCEQYRQMSHKQVADKIRAFRERYNLVWHFDPVEHDTWKLCRAIGLDMKGGGTGVRDALVFIDQEQLPPGEQRIFDPLDQDSRMLAYLNDPRALPMLDAIQPSDMLNDRCVEFTLAQFKVGQLYLPRYREGSQRLGDAALDPGYGGARILLHQLQKIQQEPTKNYRRFFMPGDEERVESKKDMFSAFLYAAKQLRAHLIRQQMLDNTPPPLGARRTQINRNRGRHGRSLGAKY